MGRVLQTLGKITNLTKYPESEGFRSETNL